MPAQAVDWLFDPYIGASATYTDNVDQSPTNENNALILSAVPGFTLRTEGSRRLEAVVDYRLTGVARFGGGDDNDLFHHLNATGSAELVEDFFFLDASARVSQELISLVGSQADAVINDSNRTSSTSYSISPYLKKRFGTFAEAEVRYTLYGSLFDHEDAADLLTNQFNASLTSGTRFNNLDWGLTYLYRDVSAQEITTISDSYVYERADLSLGYALTRKFRLIGNVGQERITYEVLTQNDIDDSVWSAGFAWEPSRRTSIEATTGQRFYGDTYSLSARYRARASAWNVSYVQDVNDISQSLLSEGTLYLYFCPAANPGDQQFVLTPFPIAPAPGCSLQGSQPSLLPSIAEGLYVAKTFSAGVSWGVSKITYSINASDVRRIYLLQNNAEDNSRRISASMNYRMTPRTNMFGNLAFDRIEDAGVLTGSGLDREDDLINFTLGVGHRFASNLTGALSFRHFRRDSNDSAADYTENNLTASVNMDF